MSEQGIYSTEGSHDSGVTYPGPDYYSRRAKINSSGPQIEGLLETDVVESQGDDSTVSAELDGLLVPLLVDNKYDSTANKPYYNERFSGDHVVRFMPVPLSNSELATLSVSMENLLSNDGATTTVVVMHEEANTAPVECLERIASENGATCTEVPLFDTRNNTEASVVHLSGLPDLNFETHTEGRSVHETFYELVEQGVYQLYPENGTTVLRPEVLTPEIKDHIWDIYNKQLDILIEQHPAYQRLTRDEVDAFLEDDSSFNIVHVVDGKVTTLFLGVTDLDSCPWLDKDKIEGAYKEEIMYCPAMVTDFEAQGHNYASNVFGLLMNIVKVRQKNLRPYVECTNISAGYMPVITERAVDATGQGRLQITPVAKYQYRAFQLSR